MAVLIFCLVTCIVPLILNWYVNAAVVALIFIVPQFPSHLVDQLNKTRMSINKVIVLHKKIPRN